jgi:hypothetical protein
VNTYCNPLPLPDYPVGLLCHQKQGWGWTRDDRPDYRETADPTALYHEGKWYLYVSGASAYVSEDFVTWKHHPIGPPARAGYAPTIVRWRDAFWFTACNAPLYRAPHPLGPFEEVGRMEEPDGTPLRSWLDPMLFADDDGRLYAYWGINNNDPGLMAAELDPARPNRLLSPRSVIVHYDPAHRWEWMGDHHENGATSFIEGAWMLKHRGRYLFTYSGPGTEWRTYGMGCYLADGPLGPFRYQARNPILQDPHGLVRGPGHGCIVPGPADTLWAFYTCLVRNDHAFERRVGLDPAGFDDEGNLFVLGASEIPQLAPGVRPRPELGNDAGPVPVSVNKWARASTSAPGRTPDYAIDDSFRTWWQPAPEDAAPWLEIDLRETFTVSSVRIHWRDAGLDLAAGRLPGPFRYRLLARAAESSPWELVLDRSASTEDLLIDYREFPPRPAARLRLEITAWPAGLDPALLEFTAFGTWP